VGLRAVLSPPNPPLFCHPSVLTMENLKERDHRGDLGVDGEILEWILTNRLGVHGLDSSVLG